jgi:hypothetical protein
MMAMRPVKYVLFPLTIVFSLAVAQTKPDLVNFKHLEHLTEKIDFYGDSVSIVHIYANYPDYRWVDAKESGPEGIACVDDAARAAVVFLRHYELTHDESSRERGRSLLKFVLAMQTANGEFYNFIFADHTINRDGKTSYQSFGWWAARGVWCMSLGYRLLRDEDPQFASLLKERIVRSIPHVEALMKKHGEVKMAGGLRVPQWLLYESGSDVTSELVLGLTEYYRATSDERIASVIKQLSEGVMLMQDGNAATFPYGLHRSWETMWHAWGNSQTYALAYAGKLLKDTAMVGSAEKEARAFYSRLLIDGMLKEIDCAAPEKKVAYEQIAYAIRPMTLGLLRLSDATGNELYQKLAGLSASWLFGNNVLNQVMYDSTTGRCFDGITDSTRVNRNSGAESTVEALYTLVELEQYPLAKKYLHYKRFTHSMHGNVIQGVFHTDEGGSLILALDTTTGALTLVEGEQAR